MDLDDLEPRKNTDYEIGADLSNLSVEELKALIGELGAEISRIEQALVQKQSQLSAADSVFKS